MNPRSFTILAALAVAAMFAALPFAVAFDSEAYTDGEAGYVVKSSDKITDAEELASGMSKESMLSDAFGFVLDAAGFSESTYFWDLTVSEGTFSYESSSGQKVDGKEYTTFASTRIADAKGVKGTYSFSYTTALLEDPDYATPDEAKVINAVAELFGTSTAHSGDMLEVTFDGGCISAFKSTSSYEDMNSTECLMGSGTMESASSADLDATITFTPSGGTPRSISVSFSVNSKTAVTADYDYGKDLSEVKAGDQVTIKCKLKSNSASYSQKVTVDGTSYKVDDLEDDMPSSWTEYDTADVRTQEYVRVEPTFTAYIDGLTDSDNVKYSKGYDAAESQYGDDFSDASPAKAKNYLPFVVGGIIFLILVGVAAAMILVKKKE